MLKKWMWITPLTVAVAGGVTGAVVGGYVANKDADPYRVYAATPVGSSNSDMIQVYFASAVNGTRLLLLPGYSHTSPLTQALGITKDFNEPIYDYMNKTGFALMDDKYGFPVFDDKTNQLANVNQPIWSTHVASAQFRTDLGSFVVGIAAAEFLNEYQYYFPTSKFTNSEGKEEECLTWATYGGDSFSSVTGYMGGLQRGIAFFNKFIAPYAKTASGESYKQVRQVFLSTDYAGNFAGNFNASGGTNLIELFLKKKVNLLVPVAGGQTQQAVRMIKQTESRTIVLGVDSAMENDTNANLELYKPGYEEVNGSTEIGGNNKIIQFSSVKDLEVASDAIMNNIDNGIVEPIQGKEGNGMGGLGYHSLGTTENKCTGISQAGYPYFVRAIKIMEELYKGQTINEFKEPSKIFNSNDWNILPNANNPNANNPESEDFANLWTDEYDKALSKISNIKLFKDLDESKNKVYYTNNSWVESWLNNSGQQEANGVNSWSYADIPNKGSLMMPLDENKLQGWFKDYYDLSTDSIDSWDQKHQTMYKSLLQWFKDNHDEIEVRKNFELKGVLTKQNYEKHNDLIRVVVSTPVSPLLDKGFCESAYVGLVNFWKQREVNIPSPRK